MKLTLAALMLAMLALGTTVGLLIGLSHSPVVGVVLPLLFSLLGGAGGFFVLKTDFSAQGPRRSLLMYSACTLAITIGTGIGVLVGMSQRGGQTPWSLIGAGDAGAFLPTDARNQALLEWVFLDARLHLLGLSREQRLFLLSRVDDSAASTEKLNVEDALASASAALHSTLPEEGVVQLRSEWTDVLDSTRLLQEILSSFPGDIPGPTVELVLDELREKLGRLEDDADDREYLAATPDASRAVSSFKIALVKVQATVFRSRSPVTEMNARVRMFLEEHADSLGALKPLDISQGLASAQQSKHTIDS